MATTPKETNLDKDTTKPSTTAPGDGPADTTDPSEVASSTTPRPGSDAVKVGTVNAVQPVPSEAEPKRDSKSDRTETYEAIKPDGTKVTVKHNLETGETSVS